MAKHLNPLEKEFLIRRFKERPQMKLSDFCLSNGISDSAFRKWLREYEEDGLDGLARSDGRFKEIIPEGFERSEASYKREIMRLRIENERLKRMYAVRTNPDGSRVYVRLKKKRSG